MKNTKFVQDDRRKRKEDEAFNTWLLTRGGVRVTAVRGDPEWNEAVARGAVEHIVRNT